MIHLIWHALEMAFFMGWEIFWALVLGFALSALIQAVVPKEGMSQLLPDASFKSLAMACGLGAASSSCSYAAVALTRSLIRKKANFIASMGFQIASTNLVFELTLLLIVLLGWQFAVSELLGGILLVCIVATFFRKFVTQKMIADAVQNADRNLLGKMEGHALMDMSVTQGSLASRIFSNKGFTAISHCFVMDFAAIWKDIVVGLLIAGALAAWVPHDVWAMFFLQNHPMLTQFWGPFIGPFVAIFSFVCSVGNIPLAAILWSGGISFGGVISFILADLIVLPILHIYWKYYGFKMMVAIFLIYYVAMVATAFIIEFLFQSLHLIPAHVNVNVIEPSLHFNSTAILNMIFGLFAIILLIRFFKTAGLHMLSMMDKPMRHH
jgi:uncharacterized membrane protein YraQ (UPF0718 family)